MAVVSYGVLVPLLPEAASVCRLHASLMLGLLCGQVASSSSCWGSLDPTTLLAPLDWGLPEIRKQISLLERDYLCVELWGLRLRSPDKSKQKGSAVWWSFSGLLRQGWREPQSPPVLRSVGQCSAPSASSPPASASPGPGTLSFRPEFTRMRKA